VEKVAAALVDYHGWKGCTQTHPTTRKLPNALELVVITAAIKTE
jgi:hypothetical protein